MREKEQSLASPTNTGRRLGVCVCSLCCGASLRARGREGSRDGRVDGFARDDTARSWRAARRRSDAKVAERSARRRGCNHAAVQEHQAPQEEPADQAQAVRKEQNPYGVRAAPAAAAAVHGGVRQVGDQGLRGCVSARGGGTASRRGLESLKGRVEGTQECLSAAHSGKDAIA